MIDSPLLRQLQLYWIHVFLFVAHCQVVLRFTELRRELKWLHRLRLTFPMFPSAIFGPTQLNRFSRPVRMGRFDCIDCSMKGAYLNASPPRFGILFMQTPASFPPPASLPQLQQQSRHLRVILDFRISLCSAPRSTA